MLEELLKQLNDEQLESVITTDVPLRIIAGAGSGKTRVITTKVAYLIEKEKIVPSKILAVTFTNKAAQEMKNRVKKIIPNLDRNPLITTFHSFCVRVLREDCEYIGISKDFTIIDASDQGKIIRDIIKRLDIGNDKNKPEKKILSKISNWKSKQLSWEEAYEETFNIAEKKWAKAFRDYEQYLNEKNYLDFDDLILKVHKLFNDNLDVREKWKKRFDYIMVDEFQDTNYTQFDLIKWLTGSRNNLTVVGDPDQTIYSWRGAKVSIILNFKEQFKNSRTVMLTENYRSTKPILDIANEFIDNNKNREKKDIFTQKKDGEIVHVKEVASRNFEAKFVSKKIKELIEKGEYKYSDIYILYRTNAWSQEFEKEFQNQKIPFQLIGGFKFRDRKVIKDVTALLRAVVFKDDLSMERVFGFTPKVGAVTSSRIKQAAEEFDLNLFDFLTSQHTEVNAISKNLNYLIKCLTKSRLLFEENKSLLELTEFLVKESGYKDRLDLKDKEDIESLQNLEAYYDQMEKYDTYYNETENELNRAVTFLQEEALSSDEESNEEINKVTLLTIHSAKGLENKVVFIVGLNKDIFPSKMSFYSMESLEEERRAFYVAITRAQELLYISYVSGEYSYISSGELGASRFIQELNPELYDIEKNIYFHSNNETSSGYKGKPNLELKPQKLEAGVVKGNDIKHIIFGKGKVVRVIDKYISVAFVDPKQGVKMIPINSNTWEKVE
ncbi:ATP-dependent helicase [Spiroplasma diminutum]|uniref:DNA 3'-5' helicase n=1 Tax=Spiroplasma diminutum CUAS-1 TaxID=1276221 RepID=S5MDK7_9MOLU|nr:UvrD-helicase domain-containing protein [Spiroplasma diminutum]AGR41803.1 ATP-dependent DNA helicase [Spiroplasma diminutum CUAS-1]